MSLLDRNAGDVALSFRRMIGSLARGEAFRGVAQETYNASVCPLVDAEVAALPHDVGVLCIMQPPRGSAFHGRLYVCLRAKA